jgi:N-acyl-D-aspartate/D-glutamate deacylase
MRNQMLAGFTAILVGVCGMAQAKVSTEEADRLGKDLTPVGGVKSGNPS